MKASKGKVQTSDNRQNNEVKGESKSENFKFITVIAVPALIAVIGWWTINYFDGQRDRTNKLRDIKTQYVEEAYEEITTGVVYYGEGNDSLANQYLENGFRKVQFFGDENQIGLVLHHIRELPKNKYEDLSDILKSLRNTLREEYQLPAIDSDILHLTYRKPALSKTSN